MGVMLSMRRGWGKLLAGVFAGAGFFISVTFHRLGGLTPTLTLPLRGRGFLRLGWADVAADGFAGA